MKPKTLQTFRTMQLAVKGACAPKSVNYLSLNGIDAIDIGDNLRIISIDLDRDLVVVEMGEDSNVESYMPLNVLSDDVIEEIIDTMQAKAVDIANRDVMVNGHGEMSNDVWRR